MDRIITFAFEDDRRAVPPIKALVVSLAWASDESNPEQHAQDLADLADFVNRTMNGNWHERHESGQLDSLCIVAPEGDGAVDEINVCYEGDNGVRAYDANGLALNWCDPTIYGGFNG